MKRLGDLALRQRYVLTVALVLAGTIAFVVANAFGDAGNPVLNTITATSVDNGNGTVTITVAGQWNWLSHGGDCNFDRSGTGVGIIWNDPTEPGWTLTNGMSVNVLGGTSGASESGNVVTLTANNATAWSSNFIVGEGITVSGMGVAGYNGNFTIASISGTQLTYKNILASGLANSGGGSVVEGYGIGVAGLRSGSNVSLASSPTGATESGSIVTLTAATPGQFSGFSTGDLAVIGGVTNAGYNGTFQLTGATANTITYTDTVSGLSASGAGTAVDFTVNNRLDKDIHPVDIGNIPADGHGPLPGLAGQQWSDPTPDATTGLGNDSQWLGGCGREPTNIVGTVASVGTSTPGTSGGHVVFTMATTQDVAGMTAGDSITVAGLPTSPTNLNGNYTIGSISGTTITTTKTTTYTGTGIAGSGNCVGGTSGPCLTDTTASGNASNVTNANVTGAGCIEYCGNPWGSWGYTTPPAGSYTFGFTHTYVKTFVNSSGQTVSGLPTEICDNIYDMHGNNAGVDNPPTIDLTADNDNSVQQNNFDIANGANCISFAAPSITTTATNGAVGGSISDTAQLSGVPSGGAGTFSFAVYNNSTCTAPALQTFGPFPVSSTGGTVTIPSGSYTPASTGKYYWTASYSGDPASLTLSADSPCNAPNEVSTVVNSKIALSLAHNPDVSGSGAETVTATVQVDNGDGAGFVAAPVGTVVTLSIDAASTATGSTFVGGGTSTTCTTVAGGTCTVQINASSTGHTVVDASASPQAGPAGSTIAVPTPTGQVTKIWVSSKISLSLAKNPDISGSGTETVTATVQVDNGTGTFVPAPDTTVVTLSIDAASTATGSVFVPGGASTTCSTSGGTGTCTVQINASSTGTTVVDAHASPQAGPAGSTIAAPTGTGSVTKTWVNSKIALSLAHNPDAVGSGTETVTATVQVDNGTGTFVNAPDGTVVTLSIDAASTATGSAFVPGGASTTCTTTGGICTVQINATSTGNTVVDANASPQAGPAGTTIAVPTGTGTVTKIWVNSKISLTLAHNPDVSGSGPETVTATVQVDNGNGTFVNAPDGTVVTLSIDAASTATGSTFVGGGSTATCTTTAGICTVQVVAGSTGTTVVDANASPQAGLAGNTIAVPTGNGSVTKIWVSSKISLTLAHNPDAVGSGPETVTATVKVDNGTGTFVNAPDGTVVTLSIDAASTAAGSTFVGAGSTTTCTTTAGICTVQINATATGTTVVDAHASPQAGPVGNTIAVPTGNGSVTKIWGSSEISLSLANNPDAVGSGPETVTATVKVDNGTGTFVNAPDGTVVTLSIDAASTATGSTFVGGGTSTTCTTTAGICTAQINATSTGTTIVDGNASPLAGPAGTQIPVPTGTGSVTKIWVSSKISLSLANNPDVSGSGPETVTATVQVDNGNGTFVAAPVGTVVTLSIDAASTATNSTFVGGGTSTTCTTIAGGTCTVQINATSTGTTIVDAHASPQAGPAGSTVAAPTGTGSVTKIWVSSKISLSLAHNPDALGSGAETVTATVQVDNGNGTFVAAPVGTVVTLTIDAASTATGSTFVGGGTSTTCTTVAGGTCTVQINATSTGTTIVDAHASPQAGPAGSTIATPTGSTSVTKTWVDARITLTPGTATNEVGSAHTFTVTVSSDPGTGTFGPVSGATVTVTLTDSNGATHAAAAGTCVTGKTDANGQCTVIVNSSTAGKVTVHATTTVSVSGVSITKSTSDGASGDSPDAVKTFVDAYITISPATANNPLNATHTYTVQVFTNDGSGAGYVAAPNGTVVTLSYVGAHVGNFTGGNTCTLSGGSCTVTSVSSVAGTDTMQATATVTVGGVQMTRTTGTTAPGHANSDNAIKNWVAPPPSGGGGTPAISITKNPKSQQINSGATATFTIVVTNTGTLTLSNVSVSDPLSPNCNQTSASIPALASMAPGASVTYNCSLGNVTASFTNVATATGTGSNGQTVTAQDSAPVTVTPPPPPPVTPTPVVTHPAITIVKDPKSQTFVSGGTAHFKITVTNSGDVTLTDVTVSDPLSTDCNRNLGTLGVGQSKSYTCSKTNVTGAFENVATATGKPPTGASVKATDHANINVESFVPPLKPKIAIVKSPKHQTVTTDLKSAKTATGATNTTVKYGTADFTIKVTNTGNTPLHSVKVSDPLSPNCNKSLGSLGVGKSKTYSCTKPTVTRAFTNVATATGIDSKGKKVTATDHADVAVTTKTTSTSGAQFTG